MFIFPVHLFNPLTVKVGIFGQTVSGGVSLSQDEDHVLTDGGGRWEIEFGGIALNNIPKRREWDAWMTYLDGGAVQCLVPLVTLDTAPRPYIDHNPMRAPQIITDDPLWPTTITYAQPYIEAKVAAIAALRATTVEIEIELGGQIKGGEAFSVGERAYRIVRPDAGDNEWIIRPPLRVALAVDDPVNFNWPVVKCRLDPGNEIADVFASRTAEVAIRFVEYDR